MGGARELRDTARMSQRCNPNSAQDCACAAGAPMWRRLPAWRRHTSAHDADDLPRKRNHEGAPLNVGVACEGSRADLEEVAGGQRYPVRELARGLAGRVRNRCANTGGYPSQEQVATRCSMGKLLPWSAAKPRRAAAAREALLRGDEGDAMLALQAREGAPSLLDEGRHRTGKRDPHGLPRGHRVYGEQCHARIRRQDVAQPIQLPEKIRRLPGTNDEEPTQGLPDPRLDRAVHPALRTGRAGRSGAQDLSEHLHVEATVGIHQDGRRAEAGPGCVVFAGDVGGEEARQQCRLPRSRLAVKHHQLRRTERAPCEQSV
mmetsp:Transcript_23441/g.65901  ORF Transcript_23441/g.65901 Transcript_23441/m.65901 type:complete len:317 (-) Transcript_23441:49-999(-)